jgi:hypothetical protein
MKKNTPNLFIALQNNPVLVQKSFSSTIKKITLAIAFLFFCSSVLAQSVNSGAPQVKELGVYLSSLKTSDQNKFNYVENLLFGLQPSIYFFSGEVKTYGEKPNTLYTDAKSLQEIDNPGILKGNIEIVNLKIINTSETIDLSKFSNYASLKYIYIVSKIDLTEQNIINMVRNYDEKYTVFYKTLKEE